MTGSTTEKAFALFARLVSEAADADTVAGLLGEAAALFAAEEVGVRWPLEGEASVLLPGGRDRIAELGEAREDVAERLRGGEVVTAAAGDGVGLFALAPLSGRTPGAVWLRGPRGRVWVDADRELARLLGRLLGRGDFLGSEAVTGVDQGRLLRRLKDASVIAGRMAHDFDNVLTGILGFTDLSLPLLPADSPARPYLTEVSKAGQKGITFTAQLHQLSRSGTTKPQPGSLAAVLSVEAERLREKLSARQRLELRVPPDLPPVAMEGGPLQIVVSHVLDNAVEALPEDGVVTVTASRVELSEAAAEAYYGAVQPGAAVELVVADTGNGMAPAARAKLFAELFYTTKVRHRGLGLAIVYRVLHAHRGGIRVDTAPGEGTTARLVFPPARGR